MVDLTTAITAAQSDLAASIDRASLRNDPLRYVIAALSAALGTFPDLLAEMRATAADARQPLDAAALARMETAAAEGASRAANALVRAHNRRSMLLGTLALTGCIAAGIGGGFWWGRADTVERMSLAETGLAALVHGDPDAAAGWMRLVRLNDYRLLMAGCRGDRVFVQAGQKACAVALWVGEPAAVAPVPPQ